VGGEQLLGLNVLNQRNADEEIVVMNMKLGGGNKKEV